MLYRTNRAYTRTLASLVTDVPEIRLRGNNLTCADFSRFSEQVTRLYEAPLFMGDLPFYILGEIIPCQHRMADEQDVKVVLLDYLNWLSAFRTTTGAGDYRSVLAIFKTYAREKGVAIVICYQLPVEPYPAEVAPLSLDGFCFHTEIIRHVDAVRSPEQEDFMSCFLLFLTHVTRQYDSV